MNENLSEKTYVVTGATSGIGLALAQQLAARGAGLIGVGRSAERCRQAKELLWAANPAARVDYLTADLSLQHSVRALSVQIEETIARRGKTSLDGLVNNAGTFTYWLTLTAEGFEMQWALNHLAPFLLTNCLLGVLRAAPVARVITVSSDSHYFGRIDWDDPQMRRRYNGLRAYGNTKLANILFTLELNRRLGADSCLRAFAADPGLVKTDIGMKGTPGMVGWLWKLRRSGGIPAAQSAQGISYLLTQPGLEHSTEVYWKHGKPSRPNKSAFDQHSASRLWNLSEQMCGLAGEVAYG